ncbi:MAG: monovalent cation/hydrogen antiporter [Thermoleophilales bacterium]|jgi:CPA1 family monovalent cation:H+ antiporter|nr:monovalent cation/hydrogen antiporter [Thermoleophilales bacterium]
MAQTQLLLLILLVTVPALSVLARVLDVPYPIVLVLAGVALGLIPGLPVPQLHPDVVLVIFLPPLLYVSAFFTDLHAMRSNMRPITLLSIGLVLATAAGVAVVAHQVLNLPWAVAFALGGILAPTDPVAATAIMRRLGAPRRLVNITEAESLLNDGSALVIYRAAVGVAVGGSFSVWSTGANFVLSVAGGIAVGIAVGWLVSRIRARIDDTPTEVTMSLFTGYAAYLPAEQLHVSGVLAAVTAGIVLGLAAPRISTAQMRLQGYATWDLVVFLINSVLFVMVGLQLPNVMDGTNGRSTATLIGYGLLFAGLVTAIRFAWLFTVTYLIRALDRREAQRARRAPWQLRAVGAWSGMRGAVTLAAALALPLQTDAGRPFPERNLIIFIAFCVVLLTIVVQGLTLPLLIRALGVREDGSEEQREELRARLSAAKVALDRLDELEEEGAVAPDTAERMRAVYRYRKNRFAARAGKVEDDGYEDRSQAYQRAVRSVLDAQRDALVEMRRDGVISNDVMHRVERELDLEDERLEI